ncbi:MAG: SdrD B-like domain-containing protein, partial [Candidatus Saccharibacteria bacterium]|nr:SdrD B-like domain-containing protein [Candidatus Saccharibacteria bacterium]
DGTLWAWGKNSSGQVGNGSAANQPTPVKVLDNVAGMAVGTGATFARKTDGTLWAWGGNEYRELGYVDTAHHKILDNVAEVAAGSTATFARKTDGTLWAWGKNSSGQVGNGSAANQPTPVKVLDDVAEVMASGSRTLARKTDGTLWVWGWNTNGQVGNGSTTDQPTPVKVLDNVAGMAVGSYHTLARKTDGTLWAWGMNRSGQVGNGSTTDQPTPVKVLDNVAGMAVGTGATFARKTDGTLWAWGKNSSGQVGNGSAANQPTPVKVLDNVAEVVAKDDTAFARKTDGTLWAWGDNYSGQLGNGSTTSQPTPVKVLDDVAEVMAGDYRTFARKTDGTLWAWGSNGDGQLGNGNTNRQNVPVPVSGTGGTLYHPADGTTTIPLSSPTAPLAWKGLYIDTESIDQPANATIRYDLLAHDCQTPIPGFANLNPARSPIDISSLPATTTHFCLKATYQNVRKVTVTARMSYEGKEDPSLHFDVVANDTVDAATINNTATISTTTPETNYNNNSSSYALRVPQADLSLTKQVSQSVMSPEDITGAKRLTYTLTLENKGPNDADRVTVTDTLPDGMTYVSAGQTSGVGNFTAATAGQTITLTAAQPVPVGGRAVFTVTTTINADPLPAANTPFYNDACAKSDMADPVTDNNCDSATVTVGSFANVYLKKAAPVKANIGKDIAYTLRYGNNGNVAAEGWSVSDPLPQHLTFVSAEQVAGDVTVACAHNQQTVTCTPQNNASLPVGATGEVRIVARVAKDQALADTNAVITNKACVTTAATQITVSDDCSTTATTVWPGDLAGFGGRVFLDFNKDVAYSTEHDKPLADVEVVATGFDTVKRVYGPGRQHPRYTEVMTALLPILMQQGVVPASTTVEAIHALPQYVILNPAKTSRDGIYSFNGLNPGTYFAHESQPALYGSTGSTGGHLGIDGATGLPVHSPQDGQGSKQSNAVGVNAVMAIVLGEGDFSQGNDFGELPGSIGSHIWHDSDNNGRRDADEAGLGGVEVTLYRDVNGDGAYTNGIDTVVTVTKTDNDGAYMFTGLPLDSGDGAAKYVVRVTDSDKATTGYTNTTGTPQTDNQSQTADGYAVTLSANKAADVTADFGYFRPLDLALTKEIDGDADGTFAAQEQIQPGAIYRYRVVIDNRSLDTATDIRAEDVLPRGVTAVKATADTGTAMAANTRVDWTIPSLAPTARATLTIEAVVAEEALAEYRAGLMASGVSRNTARITSLRQSDTDPNNNASHADAFMKAALGDRVWIDRNANGQQDDGEPGLNGVTVTLRNAAGDTVATTTTATVGGQDGIYHFGDMEPGDYTVHFTVPAGYVLTTKQAGDAATDSDADQATGTTPTLTIAQGDNNLTIDAGLVPLLAVGDIVWDDRNNDGTQNTDEPGLSGVTVMLFSDDGDGVLDITKDAQVASVKTDEHGTYRFSNLAAGNYFVVIDSADVVLSGYTASQKAATDPNDGADSINDGVKQDNVVTTARALSLQYGVQAKEHGAYNDTVDFGFHKPLPPSPQSPTTPTPLTPEQPAPQPPKSTDLANTGEGIWLIVLAGFGSIATAVTLLLMMKRRKGKK